MGQSKRRRDFYLKPMYLVEGLLMETWKEVRNYADSHCLTPIKMQTLYSDKGIRYLVNFKPETDAQNE